MAIKLEVHIVCCNKRNILFFFSSVSFKWPSMDDFDNVGGNNEIIY